MFRPASAVAFLLLSSACALPTAIDSLEDTSPPPEFGRPGWVRGAAKVGAWVGGIPGVVASVVLLPVTWPLSQIADEGLGEMAADEFVLFPALACASVGHSLFALPCDTVDYLGRRVWSEPTPMPTYDTVPTAKAAATTPAPVEAPAAPAATEAK